MTGRENENKAVRSCLRSHDANHIQDRAGNHVKKEPTARPPSPDLSKQRRSRTVRPGLLLVGMFLMALLQIKISQKDEEEEEKDAVRTTKKKMYQRPIIQPDDWGINCILESPGDEGDSSTGFRPDRRDMLQLGPCKYNYLRLPLPNEFDFLNQIDYFHFRESHRKREECFLYCIHQIEDTDIKGELLIDAAKMGLTNVARELKTKFGLDPLFQPQESNRVYHFNAIQEAIRGGYAEMVQVLSDSNNQLVIDKLGRTIADYVRLRGSPIRPADAAKHLFLKIKTENIVVSIDENDIPNLGWDQRTSFKADDRCDIDILDYYMTADDFYNIYYMTGRPFLLRGLIGYDDLQTFSKHRWQRTFRFHPYTQVKVGPTAYPGLTGQEWCNKTMSISDIERNVQCDDLPGVPMVHARHPSFADLRELFPAYNGEIFKAPGWRNVEEWFGWRPNIGNWQFFLGGDQSGATLHWHPAAFNTLYTGVKEWRLTPPQYRGFTGMEAVRVATLLDDSTSLRCTQRPGDLVYIPDYWGHLTMNHGFSVGAAIIFDKPPLRPGTSTSNNEKRHFHHDLYPRGWPQKISHPSAKRTKKLSRSSAESWKKLFFVHINKAGGSSVIQMLREQCPRQYVDGQWDRGYRRSFHATAQSFIDKFGEDMWNDAYTFAVVRHPLARQVSNFFFLIAQCAKGAMTSRLCMQRMIPRHSDVEALSDDEKVKAFHDYIAALYDRFPPVNKKHFLFGSYGHGNEAFESFNATQTSWLIDENGSIAVKHIFRLEDISKNVSKLSDEVPCLRAGVEGSSEARLLHTNASPRYPDIQHFRNNEETNRIIREVYAVDFKNFGYDP